MDPARHQFKAIAFDVDGTLYADFGMYIHTLGWSLRNLRLIRVSLMMKNARDELRERAPIANFYDTQSALVAKSLGKDAETTHKLIHQGIYGDWEKSLKGMRLESGLIDCLKDLRAAGLKLGVLSDFPVTNKLDVLGVGEHFDQAVCTEELGCLKPHPHGFLKLAADLGEKPADILFVGNSYSFDVLGAAGVGMKTAHYTRKAHPGSIADLSFHSYKTLRDWILGTKH